MKIEMASAARDEKGPYNKAKTFCFLSARDGFPPPSTF